MNTLLLDQTNWDLVVDAHGNIAMATEPYALAQDVASACKTFLGEVWYNTSLGINYQDNVLGKALNAAQLKKALTDAALEVPGVVSAVCTIQSFENRVVTGIIRFVDENGVAHDVKL